MQECARQVRWLVEPPRQNDAQAYLDMLAAADDVVQTVADDGVPQYQIRFGDQWLTLDASIGRLVIDQPF